MTYEEQTPYVSPARAPQSVNGLAIASLVTSLISLQLIGIVLGHIALVQIKKTGQAGRGLALAGVIIGYSTVALVLIIAAIAIPVFMGQKSSMNEQIVKSDLQTAWTAVIAYGAANPGVDEVPSFTDGTLVPYGLTQSPFTETLEATGTYSTGITLVATTVDGHTFQISDGTGIVDLGD
jgi:hypothetical protein